MLVGSSAPVRESRADGMSANRNVPPWIYWVARCGFVAEGAMYFLLGGFALVAATFPHQRPQGYLGAMHRLAELPLGGVMLVALLAGLAAFAAWKLIQATFDPVCRDAPLSGKRLLVRLAYLCSAVIQIVLIGGATWQLLLAHGATNRGRTTEQWITWAMQQPRGRWLVAFIGIGIAVFGFFQIYRAVTARIGRRIDWNGQGRHHLIVAISLFGVMTRGIVFALIGVLLSFTAWRSHADRAQGLVSALYALREQVDGSWLLGVVALGLMAYGVFQFAKARYFHV
jgi:Domain of Unknown Function (DUF1206)